MKRFPLAVLLVVLNTFLMKEKNKSVKLFGGGGLYGNMEDSEKQVIG